MTDDGRPSDETRPPDDDPEAAGFSSRTAATGARRTITPPDEDERFPLSVRGVAVAADTRCVHYDSPADVVAIRFPCCGCYYPCFRCHAAVATHDAERIPVDRFDAPAVLCGVCGATLSARTYLDCGDACPACGTAFNPGCRRHRNRYFESDG